MSTSQKTTGIEEEYTSQDALKEWEATKDQSDMTQNIVALLGIHGMHCTFFKYQNASHITKAFEELFHHQLQKAREEWLREEIVRLEGMTNQPLTKPFVAEIYDAHNFLLQTIIDRYQAEIKGS